LDCDRQINPADQEKRKIANFRHDADRLLRPYFPWLYWSRGYVVALERDYERLQRQLQDHEQLTAAAPDE
jgi:hypothetical protein